MRIPRAGKVVPLYLVSLVSLSVVIATFDLPEQLLTVMVVPVILGGVHYSRRAYALMFTPLVTSALVVGWATEGYSIDTIETIAAISIALVVVVEMLRRFKNARHEIEKELRLTHFSVDKAVDAVYWVRPDARFTYVNDKSCGLLGYTREELLKMKVPDIAPDVDLESWERHWHKIKAAGSIVEESRCRTKDGRMIPVEVTLGYIAFEGEEFVCVFARNITNRKQAEEAIKRAQEKYRLVVENASDGVIIAQDHMPLYFNHKALEISGYSEDEFARVSPYDILHPEDRHAVTERHASHSLGSTDPFIYECRILDKQGQTRWVKVNSIGVYWDDKPASLLFVTDVTDSKRAGEERRSLEAQVRHAQKLESLGLLAGGIAHDFNNLLVGILGNAGLALRHLSPGSQAQNHVQRIETAARHAADLTNQMLAYSGKGTFVVQTLYLSDLVEEIGHLLEASISKMHVLKYNFAENLPPIRGDHAQIQQVIMNLITNASDAIGGEPGAIKLSTRLMDVDRGYLAETFLDDDLCEGQYVCLEVSDTGCGMDSETRVRIFDPFFTTKFAGRGLGLAAVLGIVRGHRGAIKVYSEIGRGTTFKVLLPADLNAHRLGRQVAKPQDEADLYEWRNEGIALVADDEENVQDVAREVLEDRGMRVITASDGREAVEIFLAHADKINVVLLDLTMPEMNGEQAFEKMQGICPDVPIILTSGYTEQDAIEGFEGRFPAAFLQKPFMPKDLIRAFRRVLGPGQPAGQI